MLADLRRWSEENRWAGDAALATALLFVLLILSVVVNPFFTAAPMTLLLVLPLYFRRTVPEAVTIAVAALCVIQVLLIPYPIAGDLVVPFVVYNAAANVSDPRWGRFTLAAALGGSAIGALRWARPSLSSYTIDGSSVLLLAAFAGAGSVLAAYLLGVRRRERREHVAEHRQAEAERTRLRTAERESRHEAGAAAERARIARELHDIVAHALSVIVIQADGGAAAARSTPEIGPQVLETIAATSRDALGQMRRMVSVLRSGTAAGAADADYAPAPGADDLDDLVAQVRGAGVPVDLDVIGTPRTLTEGTGLIVYRVVQESLTNVLKHAGPAATCRVVLHYGPDQVVITVADDGRGAATVADGGHGLEGMHERVGLAGGTMRAGPRLGGGFEVTATVPAPGGEPPSGEPPSDAPPTSQPTPHEPFTGQPPVGPGPTTP